MDRIFGTDTSYQRFLKRTEDFQVEEIIEPKFLRKFSVRVTKVKRMEGDFAVCLLEKRVRTTEEALKDLLLP